MRYVETCRIINVEYGMFMGIIRTAYMLRKASNQSEQAAVEFRCEVQTSIKEFRE